LALQPNKSRKKENSDEPRIQSRRGADIPSAHYQRGYGKYCALEKQRCGKALLYLSEAFTVEGHLKWLETEVETEKCYQFIVCLKEDDTPVGSTFLRDYSPEHRKAEYGIFLGSDRIKGRGIGTESLQLTLRFAFEHLNLHKVFSRIFKDNEVSVKTLLKCGFHQEGCLIQDVIVNGEYRDLVLLAILNPADGSQE